MDKLKPCPFCGGNKDEPYMDTLGVANDYHVTCGTCFLATNCFKTKKEAIKAWNTRHDDWHFDISEAPKKDVFLARIANIKTMSDHQWALLKHDVKYYSHNHGEKLADGFVVLAWKHIEEK